MTERRPVMLVTMGTSLFHSATWEAKQGTVSDIPYYQREWVENEEALCSPDERLTSSFASAIRAELRSRLNVENGLEWAAYLPQDLKDGMPTPGRHLMRYSAELTTILKLAGSENAGDFLRSYEKVLVLVDKHSPLNSTEHWAMISGAHLVCYLEAIAGSGGAISLEGIPGLASTSSEDLIGSAQRKGALQTLGGLLQKLVVDEVDPPSIDIVISGGYKMYGIGLAHLTNQEDPRVRLIYVHENGDELMIYSQSSFELAGKARENPLPERLTTRRMRSRGEL
jgi:hypothetical protein